MCIILVKIDDESVTTESSSNRCLQAGACEGLPVQFFPFYHGLVGFWNSSVQAQIFSVLLVGFELSGKFLFVVFKQLFFHHCDHRRNLIVLVSAKLGVYFFVCVVASVEVYETFERSIMIILELVLSLYTLPNIRHFLNHIRHNICNRGFIAL